MFNVGPAEMAVLAILAVVVFGPDRLPNLARQAAQMLRTVRDMSTNARAQLRDLSPGLDESLKDLDLGGLTKGGRPFNARTALQKMIFEDEPAAPTAASAAPAVPPPISMEKAAASPPAAGQPAAGQPAPLSAVDDIT